MRGAPGNAEIAKALEEAAYLLERQAANPFRARAYRRAARSVREERASVAARVREGGPEALHRLAGVGPGLASAIEEFVRSGRLRLCERLRAQIGGGPAPQEKKKTHRT